MRNGNDDVGNVIGENNNVEDDGLGNGIGIGSNGAENEEIRIENESACALILYKRKFSDPLSFSWLRELSLN